LQKIYSSRLGRFLRCADRILCRNGVFEI
jgi:hypothetical protein